MAEDFQVMNQRRKQVTVRAASHLAAGWIVTRNPPPDMAGVMVQWVARVGHPFFPWEGLIKQGDDVVYCRIGYDLDGVRHTQDVAIRASSEDGARRLCGMKPSDIKSFEAQYSPFHDNGARMPRDGELHNEWNIGEDWDDYTA